jgi:undecaprenyl-diphosphatase
LAGSVTAFVVGIISIHFFIKYLKHHDFKVFVWYRVFIAILILALL